MKGRDNSLQIAPNALDGGNRHVCAFFNGMDEHYRVLRSFLKDGFDEGDKAFHLVDPERREDHLRRLADAGIKVEEAIASGQLEVRPWEDGPLHGARFDQDRWLAGFEEALGSGRASGYAKTRFLSQMEWALVDLPGIGDMIEFGAGTVMYALRTHPLVIIGGLLQENPFYVEPDQLLLELREQQSRVGASLAD